jgi:uncharacterized protein (DUF1330 family)
MPKGYWITRVDVYGAEQFEKYKAANVELFARYHACFLIREARRRWSRERRAGGTW